MAGPGLLAPTTYAAGPNDKLAVVDVYKRPGAAVINSWQDQAAKVGLNLNLALSGSAGGFAGSIIASVKNGKVTLNAQAILGRLTGSNTQLGAAIRTVSDGVRSAMAIPGQLINSVTASVNGTIQAISSEAMNDVRGIANIVNAAANGNYGITISDNGALGGLVASVSIQGAGLGLPKVFSTLAATISSPNVLMAAGRLVAQNAVLTGNISLFNDVASVSFGASLSSVFPSAVRGMCASARPVPGTSRSAYPGIYASLKTSFTAVDPSWDRVYRLGDVVPEPGVVVNSQNPYMRDLVESSAYSEGNNPMYEDLIAGLSAQNNLTDDKITYAAIAAGPTSVRSSLTQNYPQVNTELNPTNTVQDYTPYSREQLSRMSQNEFQKQLLNDTGKTVTLPGTINGQVVTVNPDGKVLLNGSSAPPPAPPPLPVNGAVDEFGYTKAQRDAIGNTMVQGDNGKMVRFTDAPSVMNNYNTPAGAAYSAKSISFD